MMNGIWLFVHYLGFIMWLGGGFSAMVAGIGMKRIDRSLWGAVVDAQAAIYRVLIGPGALITVLTGFVMTMEMYNGLSTGGATPWLATMQGAGILGALVMLLGAMPASLKLSRLEPLGRDAPAFDALRKRLAITASIGGTLALIALLAGALYRPV
ncbi:MAG: hypothetical protein ACREL5_04420 [Gemmatimonadales bacterium]